MTGEGLMRCVEVVDERVGVPEDVMIRPVLLLYADAYHSAKMLCEQYYLSSPDLFVQEVNSKRLCYTTSLKTSLHPQYLI